MVADKYFRFLLSLAFLATLNVSCANSPIAKKLEESFASDPKLQENQNIFGTTEIAQKEAQKKTKTDLPVDFPEKLRYPQAVLQEVNRETDQKTVSTIWQSSDPSNIIAGFYTNQLPKDDWRIIEEKNNQQLLIFRAQRNNVQLEISIQPLSIKKPKPNQPQTNTEIIIKYLSDANATALSTNSRTDGTENSQPSPGSPNFIGPVLPKNSSPSSSESSPNSNLNKVPLQLQTYIQDVLALGILEETSTQAKTTQAKNNSVSSTKQLELNKNITRGQYARLLVNTYNRMYANLPAKQIRLASEGSKAAFTDVPPTHPDFSFIQGLADAGLIPSSLSGDSSQVLFQPNAPLIREQLVLWKAPLDTRQALPQATINSIEKTWGFQDAGKINSKALRAVFADFQNGDKSTIRRVFGYTTLFQPKKPVTHAEALAALWYFGTESEGVSAKDALSLN
ncbi:MAG: S-layer homology domain-containing protein [Cyanobacteria bacterium P01_A01_bin.45]